MTKTERVAAIIAITQLLKEQGVPSRFCPWLAIALGALFGYVEDQTARGILDGVVMGAMATGGYAVIKGSAREVLKAKQPSTETLEHDDYRDVSL